MAKTDSENSSSSSSSRSESDSSSSDEVEAIQTFVNETNATSNLQKSSSKGKRVTTNKSSKKNYEDSSSESVSSSSDDEDEESSSSSCSSSSSSEPETGEEEGVQEHPIKPIKVESGNQLSPGPPVQEVVEAVAVKSEDSVEKTTHVEESKNKDISVCEPAHTLKKIVQEKPVIAAVSGACELREISNKADPVTAIETTPSVNSESAIVTEVVSVQVASIQPESEKEDHDESKQEKIVKESEEVVQRIEQEIPTPAVTNQTDAPDDGEPELKKKKLEAIPERMSKPTDPPKEPTNDTKTREVRKKRLSKDRSRSPDRRYRRRSRERDDRIRRQRSRSRSINRRRRRSRTRSRSNDKSRDKQDRRRERSPQKKNDAQEQTDPNEKITERQRRTVDLLTSRTGGAYIPPAKLRMMQAEITDKASAAYQRIAWEALKKSIHGYINKVNVDNIGIITRELLKENIVRGRGLLCRSIIQAQAASPTFTHVYAALVAIINSKFPNIGELLLKRLVIQFKRAFRRNDKAICLSASRFVAHLVNQRVAHEILALEILTLLVETPTDDSVEVAIAFLKECGMKLTEVSSKGIGAIFEMLKNILHEGKLDKRVQYMIEVVFQVRKDGFKDHQSVVEALELVEEDDQFTHLLMLDEATTTEDNLNAFKFDDKYETNEDKYKGLSKEILGSDASDDGGGSGSGSDESDSEEDEEEKAKAEAIIDNTETNLVALRRTIYLTINSSLDYEECAHKLMKMQLKPGQEIELCHMFLDCCAEQRTYEKFYGLLAQRFCSINKTYIGPFEEIFKDTYQTTHRLDTNRLRNVSKFFAHLLFTDAIGWDVIDCIKLNEDDTTSSSRIFIKILFQELAEYMGLGKLNEKLKDAVLTESLEGLFPKDNPRNTRFAINFFTSIGLGGLTDDLRQFLKNAPKNVPAINSELLPEKIEVSSTSSSSSSSPSSSSSSDSSSESSSSEDKKQKRKKKKNIIKKKVVKKSKKKLKPDPKKKHSKKKHETSSSESASSESSTSSSSSSESSTTSSDSSSDDDKNKKQKRVVMKVDHKKKKQRNDKTEDHPTEQEGRRHREKEPVVARDDRRGREKEPAVGRDDRRGRGKEPAVGRDDRRGKEKADRRNKIEERVSNGKSENGRERDDKKINQDDRALRERSDRKVNRMGRSPNRDHRYRDNYNQAKNNYQSTGKTRNGSKERG